MERQGLKNEYDCIQFLYFHFLSFFLPKVLSLQITSAGLCGNLSFIIIWHSRLSRWRGGEWNEARYLRSFSCGAPGRGRCFICRRHGGRQQVQMSSCSRRSVKQRRAIFSCLIMDSPIGFDDNPWMYKVRPSRRLSSGSSRGAEITSWPSSRLFCLHFLH